MLPKKNITSPNSLFALILIILIILSSISCKANNETYSQIPDFSLKLIDGSYITKANISQKQQPYFFHFFSVTCPTCHSELIDLKTILDNNEYSVTVIAINVSPTNTTEHLKTFQENLQLPFNIAEFNNDLINKLKITEQSTKIGIDKFGNIIYRDGFGQGNSKKWIELFEKLDSSKHSDPLTLWSP